MAEDPKLRAHNERMRLEAEAERKAAAQRRHKDEEKLIKGEHPLVRKPSEQTGCVVLFGLMTGLPLAAYVASRFI